MDNWRRYSNCRFSTQPWDRSHFLENLSGYETDCAMIGKREWHFTQARHIAGEAGVTFTGLFGYARNRGSTTNALREIFESFKEVCYLQLVLSQNNSAA